MAVPMLGCSGFHAQVSLDNAHSHCFNKEKEKAAHKIKEAAERAFCTLWSKRAEEMDRDLATMMNSGYCPITSTHLGQGYIHLR